MKTRMMSQFNEFNRISFPQCLWGLTMAMIMATVLAQSQGRVWQGTCLMAEKRRSETAREMTNAVVACERSFWQRRSATTVSRLPAASEVM